MSRPARSPAMLHDAPAACWPPLRAFHPPPCALVPRRRAFYDKRVSQEVDGECLGEVRRLRRPPLPLLAHVVLLLSLCLWQQLLRGNGEGQHSRRRKSVRAAAKWSWAGSQAAGGSGGLSYSSVDTSKVSGFLWLEQPPTIPSFGVRAAMQPTRPTPGIQHSCRWDTNTPCE